MYRPKARNTWQKVSETYWASFYFDVWFDFGKWNTSVAGAFRRDWGPGYESAKAAMEHCDLELARD